MILLALGSNLGNRESFLEQARGALVAYDVEVVRESSIHETPALLPEGAPAEWNIAYLNQVIRVETHLSPEDLLSALKDIELELGRTPRARWAPREIDLDILAYHDQIVLTDHLTVPHPHLDTRAFVLKPMAEVAPNWVHPIFDKTTLELLAELPA